jgi:hypothetical protein
MGLIALSAAVIAFGAYGKWPVPTAFPAAAKTQ